jgi:hypothetical protein
MLLLQTALTLMTGFMCQPAVRPAADLVVSALTSIEPPIVCRSGDAKKVKKAIVRDGRCADGEKPRECEGTCRVVVKRIERDGAAAGCCEDSQVACKGAGSGSCDKPGCCEAKSCKIVACLGKAVCGDPSGPRSIQKKVIIMRDGEATGCCDEPRVIRKRIGSGCDPSACGEPKSCKVVARPGMAGCGGPAGPGVIEKKIRIELDGNEPGPVMKRFRINLDDEDDGPAVRDLLINLDDEEAGPAVKTFCIKLDDEDPAVADPQTGEFISVFNVADDAPAPGGPWLGLQFGPVSKPLASHLNLSKGVGQMVLNVVEDSPADKAGLQQYDVIVQIDGRDASAEIENFMEIVKGFEPGQKHKFSVIRGSRPVEVTVEVGARPEGAGAAKFKYEAELEELAQSDVLQRGGLLRRGPDGQWAFEGLGDLKDMPKYWEKHLPDEQSLKYLFDMVPGGPGAECKVMVRTDKGETLEIRCEDGKITVTRRTTDEAGGEKKVTTRTFANEEELNKEDPDAYKMMKECDHGGKGVLKNKNQKIFITPRGDHLKFVPQELQKELQELQTNAKQSREETAKAQAEAEKAFDEAMKKHGETLRGDFFAQQKARTSFDVATDGTIRVTTRKGNEELTQAFQNADALKKARPDLYEKYQKLHEGGKAKSQE